jgi:hypothetical protein
MARDLPNGSDLEISSLKKHVFKNREREVKRKACTNLGVDPTTTIIMTRV